MIKASGIGTYIRNIISFFFNEFEIYLIVNPDKIDESKWQGQIKIIPFQSNEVYSLKDQVLLSFKIPKCDIFWAPHYNAPLFTFNASVSVLTVHDVFHMAYADTLSSFQRLYVSSVIKGVIKKYDYIITVSEFSKGEILKYLQVDEKKIKVIPNGIDPGFFNENKDVQHSSDVLPEKYLLFVGNVKPHKNITGLLRSFKEIIKEEQFQNLKLVIVGQREGFIQGIYNIDEMLDEWQLNYHVVFTGNIQDQTLKQYYQKAELLVFPSFYEGFGLPPLEAMACGTPAVVSNRASMPEVCGDACLYFDPYNTEEIKNSVLKVLKDQGLKKRLIQKGLERAKLYDWAKTAKEHISFFKYFK